MRGNLTLLIAALAFAGGGTAAAAPDAFVLKAGFRPNPMIVDAVPFPPTGNTGRDYSFYNCYIGVTSKEPAFTFSVEGETQHIRVLAGHAWPIIQNAAGKYWCGGKYQDLDKVEANLEPGRYSVWFVTNGPNEHPRSSTVSLVVDDLKRPIQFPDGGRTIAVPAHPTQPIVIEGDVTSQPEVDRGWCGAGRFGREPDFFLHAAQPIAEVQIELAWAPKRELLRVLRPDEARRPNCPVRDEPYMRFNLFEGVYAVWVGDAKSAPGTHYRVAVTTKDMKLDPMTTFSRPIAGMTLAQRELARHYWRLHRFKSPHGSKTAGHDPLIERLFLEAPRELFVFTRVDLSAKQVTYESALDQWNAERERDSLPLLAPAPPRAGEPLLVMSAKGDFLTADGETVAIDPRLVSLDPPSGGPVVPRAPRLTEAPYKAAEELAESDEPKQRAAFTALAQKTQDCYTRYMDQHNKSGDARQFEVVTHHGGSVTTENLADRYDRLASAACHVDRLDKERPKITALMASARTKRRTAQLAKIDQRLRALFAPDATRAAATTAPATGTATTTTTTDTADSEQGSEASPE
jgi:hypothetical protein